MRQKLKLGWKSWPTCTAKQCSLSSCIPQLDEITIFLFLMLNGLKLPFDYSGPWSGNKLEPGPAILPHFNIVIPSYSFHYYFNEVVCIVTSCRLGFLLFCLALCGSNYLIIEVTIFHWWKKQCSSVSVCQEFRSSLVNGNVKIQYMFITYGIKGLLRKPLMSLILLLWAVRCVCTGGCISLGAIHVKLNKRVSGDVHVLCPAVLQCFC